MGAIQNSVNNIIGTAAIGVGLYANSPIGQRMAELRTLKTREKAVNKQYSALMNRAEDKPGAESTMDPAEAAVYDSIVTQGREIAKKRFELEPSDINLQRFNNALTTGITSQEWAAAQAQASMEAAQAQKQAQQELANKPRLIDQYGNDLYGRK